MISKNIENNKMSFYFILKPEINWQKVDKVLLKKMSKKNKIKSIIHPN